LNEITHFRQNAEYFFHKYHFLGGGNAYTLEVHSQYSLNTHFKLEFKYISTSLLKKCQTVTVAVSEKQPVHTYVAME